MILGQVYLIFVGYVLKITNFYIFAIITMLIYAIVLFFYYDESQKNAINQAQIRTEDILRNVKATDKFFNEDQQDQYVNKDAFSSELSSCTNATIKINDYYNKLRKEDLLKK